MIPREAKRQLMTDVGSAGGISSTTLHFLWVLSDNDRLDNLMGILEAFDEEYEKAMGILNATVTSASDLDDDQQLIIAKKLQELTGCADVKLTLKLDPDLLGGFTVQYGSRFVDCSGEGWMGGVANDKEECEKDVACCEAVEIWACPIIAATTSRNCSLGCSFWKTRQAREGIAY